jgi:hypothetical protein
MFPRISGSKVWLPYTVETEDGARGCGTYELGGLNRHAEDGRTLSIVLSLPKLAIYEKDGFSAKRRCAAFIIPGVAIGSAFLPLFAPSKRR